MSYKGPPTFLQSMYSLKNVNGKLLPGPSTSVTENFIKNKINNLKSNFDQASQRKIKNLTLYGKINYKNAKKWGTIMMPLLKAPIYSNNSSAENPISCYQHPVCSFGNFYLFFGKLYPTNMTSYIDLYLILVPGYFSSLPILLPDSIFYIKTLVEI